MPARKKMQKLENSEIHDYENANPPPHVLEDIGMKLTPNILRTYAHLVSKGKLRKLNRSRENWCQSGRSGHKNGQNHTFRENANNVSTKNDRMPPNSSKSSQLHGLPIYIGPRAGSRSLNEKNDLKVPKN